MDKRGEKKKLRVKQLICNKWKEIGDLIDISYSVLDAWSKSYHEDPLECIRCVLDHWLMNSTVEYPASWEGLCHLLEDIQLKQLAEDLKQALDSPL